MSVTLQAVSVNAGGQDISWFGPICLPMSPPRLLCKDQLSRARDPQGVYLTIEIDMRRRAILGQALCPMQRNAPPIMRRALREGFRSAKVIMHAMNHGSRPLELGACTSGALLELYLDVPG